MRFEMQRTDFVLEKPSILDKKAIQVHNIGDSNVKHNRDLFPPVCFTRHARYCCQSKSLSSRVKPQILFTVISPMITTAQLYFCNAVHDKMVRSNI